MKVYILVISIFIGLIYCKAAKIGIKKLTPLRMVSKVNNVEEERIACNGVLITRRILLASGTCIYENFKLYKHDYAFIYNDQLMKIIIDENNIFFNENLSRNFDPSLRNFALIINKEEMNPQYAIEYFYHFARNDDKINFTDCVVQTPSDLTTLDEAHSCMSSEYSDTINRVKNVNKINCPNIDSLWRDDDLLICTVKNKPNITVLGGFMRRGSKNLINLSDLGPIIRRKLAKIKILSSKTKLATTFISIWNFFRFFSPIGRY